ncbi:MAG: ABC transporter substrate-binding protein [Firmicutes bacterium]|nr:ABC transporter substrate-binding protein [Bacillota bacterium]
MRKPRSRMVSLLGAAALSLTVAGCGTLNSVTSASASKAQKPVTITFWYGPGAEPQTSAQEMNYLVHQFEKTHPHIKVDAVPVSTSDSYVKYSTAMASGTPPNVIMTLGYGHVMVWAADHLTQPLNQYLKKYHFKLPQYYAPVEVAMRHDGEIYGLCQQVDEPMLLWNKTMFKKAGISGPPTTMAQLEADVKKLTIIKDGKLVQAGLIPNQRWGNSVWVRYFGGSWFNAKTGTFDTDKPQNIQAFTFLNTLYKIQGGYNKATAFANSAKFGNPFFSGQEAMEIGGEWVPQEIQQEVPHLNYGVAPVPVANGYKPGSITFISPGDFFVLPSRISHVKASVEFMLWMDSPFAVNYFCDKGYNLPPTPASSRVGSPFWKEDPVERPWLAELQRGMNHAATVSVSPVYEYWESTRPNYEQEILTGRMSPKAGLQALQKNISAYAQQFSNTHPGW